MVISTDFDSMFQCSTLIPVDDNTCTKIVHAFPGLINFQGANLSNEHFYGGEWEVISYSGHFKLLLIVLLKDFPQLLLVNLQVLGKLVPFSSYLYGPRQQKCYSHILCIDIHVSPGKSEGKLADETWAVSKLSMVFCIACLSNSKQ